MKLFDNIKKRKIVKEIKAVHNLYSPIDEVFFLKYDYDVISKLEEKDYSLSSIKLGELLDLISLVGKKLDNVDIFDFNFDLIKKILLTKDDYLYLDTLCLSYDIKQISEYISFYNVSEICDVSSDKLDDFFKFKEFKSSNSLNIPKLIKTYQDSVNYVKICSFLTENGLDENIFYNYYYKFNDLCSSFNFDKLSDDTKNNLLDYFYITFYNYFSIDLKTIEDLLNYDKFKQEAIDNFYALDTNDKSAFIFMVCNSNDYENVNSILRECCNLDKIYNMKHSSLLDKFEFNDNELEFIEVLSKLQKENSGLFRLYKKYRESGENFRNINLFDFRNKLRNVYANEISLSLTKLVNSDNKLVLPDTKYLGSKEYGVPLYEKEYGDFKFLVHSIVDGMTLNLSIYNEVNKEYKNFFDNPELWNDLSSEKGTNVLSTSIISSFGTSFINGDRTVIYGFDELDYKSVRNISSTDGATSHDTDGYEAYGGGREKMMYSDDLIESALSSDDGYNYNEVAFNRYDVDGIRKKPNFILCFDYVSEVSVKHAKYHQVPILVIKTKKYLEDFESRLLVSGAALANCDKNNLSEYYENLKKYLKEMLRYKRMPSVCSGKKIDISKVEINKIQEEIEELEKKIRANNLGKSNVK